MCINADSCPDPDPALTLALTLTLTLTLIVVERSPLFPAVRISADASPDSDPSPDHDPTLGSNSNPNSG